MSSFFTSIIRIVPVTYPLRNLNRPLLSNGATSRIGRPYAVRFKSHQEDHEQNHNESEYEKQKREYEKQKREEIESIKKLRDAEKNRLKLQRDMGENDKKIGELRIENANLIEGGTNSLYDNIIAIHNAQIEQNNHHIETLKNMSKHMKTLSKMEDRCSELEKKFLNITDNLDLWAPIIASLFILMSIFSMITRKEIEEWHKEAKRWHEEVDAISTKRQEFNDIKTETELELRKKVNNIFEETKKEYQVSLKDLVKEEENSLNLKDKLLTAIEVEEHRLQVKWNDSFSSYWIASAFRLSRGYAHQFKLRALEVLRAEINSSQKQEFKCSSETKKMLIKAYTYYPEEDDTLFKTTFIDATLAETKQLKEPVVSLK